MHREEWTIRGLEEGSTQEGRAAMLLFVGMPSAKEEGLLSLDNSSSGGYVTCTRVNTRSS